MKTFWELRYDRAVTAFLYSLRSTDVGTDIHAALKALQSKDDPTEGSDPIQERSDRYQLIVGNYQVRFEVVGGPRRVIRILSVTLKFCL